MNELNGYDIEDLEIRMTASVAKTIAEADIILFASASSDNNAIHINDEFARGTPFGGHIAHGFLTANTISAAIASQLPGPGLIYISQQMNFVGSVRPGDTVHAKVTVKELIPERCRAILQTTFRVGNSVFVDGQETVKTTSRAKRGVPTIAG